MGTYNFKTATTDAYLKAIAQCKQKSFYNIQERISFLKTRNRKVELFTIEKKGEVVGAGSWQRIPARSGAFVYFQHSPVCLVDNVANDSNFWQELYNYAKEIGKKENVVYVRLTPRIIETSQISNAITDAGFQKAPVQEVDACVTRIINLDDFSDKEISKEIREQLETAEKQDLSVDIKSDASGLESFMMLYKKSLLKSETSNLPIDYMKNELETYLKAGKLVITLVHDPVGNVYSGSATVLGDRIAWYYWTVTTDKGNEFGSHALMIRTLVAYLKEQKFKIFDLWGEAVLQEVYDKKLSHPWLKIDQFKKGFGSTLIKYILPIDVPINLAIYRASCLYQRFNMTRRGYPFLTFERDNKLRKV